MADAITPQVDDQAAGEGWHLYLGDCVEVTRGFPDGSLHYTIFSPPFESLYTFSDSPRDMSNCRDSETFWRHFRFLIAELYRATMPGRLVSIHCMQLPTSKLRDGYVGLRDFRGEIIRAFQDGGFIYHSETCIRKDPVSAMQRTKAIGLLHKQVVKDSTLSRCAVADYVVDLRKPGDNPQPVAGRLERYHGDDMSDDEHTRQVRETLVEAPNAAGKSRDLAAHKSIMVWQRYAEPIWTDIAQSDVLTSRTARAQADERHISPLQLTVIRRRVDLYSNAGDVVFSPFAGIGSELYVAVDLGRRAVGAELKRSYFDQAVRNLEGLALKDTVTDLPLEAAE